MQLDTIKKQPSKQGLLLPSTPTFCFTFSIKIKSLDGEILSEALLDTDATACFMDKDFATKHHIVLVKKKHPAPVEVIDGQSLASRNVMEETQPLEVTLRDQTSKIVFNIIQCQTNPIVLGLPWFELHNPDIDWRSRSVISRKRRHGTRNPQPSFIGAKAFMKAAKNEPIYAIYATPMSNSIQKATLGIPRQYQDCEDVFEKKNADILPKHRPYNCAIEF